ncbi:hydrogenase maturation protease [Corynebacterium aquilae]|uniref:Hydrogenase maturation protease n=1 Tax=Corynebacterium aquilae DSM 44791 TaxID=1431546 RepID=A0A1L7CDS7_9CORY|nr:hypothetical protein CAQU_01860 [Corynebacterium aquilae DSM 44791]
MHSSRAFPAGSPPAHHITVVGIGNPIMGDDGTGLAIMNRLAELLAHSDSLDRFIPAGVPVAGWDKTMPTGKPHTAAPIARYPHEVPSPAAAAQRPMPATDARSGATTGDWVSAPTASGEASIDHLPITFVDGGTSGMDLLPVIQDAQHLLILDAVAGPGSAGNVVELHGDQIPRLLNTSLSPHQVGLLDLLAAARLLGHEPTSVAVVGIVAHECELGVGLSDPVARSVGEAATRAEAIVRGWLDEEQL